MIKKAVIPAAGLGTRCLPATKSMPKEMLFVSDGKVLKPSIQHVVEEAIDAGIEDILIITGIRKRAVEDHFDTNEELERVLEEKAKSELLAHIRAISDREDIEIHYIRQKKPKGLGHAIYKAKKHIGDDPFVVLLPDDIIDPFYSKNKINATKQLIDVYNNQDLYKSRYISVIGVQPIPRERIHLYGIIQGSNLTDKLVRITNMVEKPSPDDVQSNLAAIGRYLFTPEIFNYLEMENESLGGEIQLTPSINRLSQDIGIYAYIVDGRRFDTGNPKGLLDANLWGASKDENMRSHIYEEVQKIKEYFGD